MSLTVEKILNDARLLVSRLKEHDCTADTLIAHTQTLHKRIDAMKQYEDDLTELNEIARHRPRSTLVMGIAQENRQIRELQQENYELRYALEEHQSALGLIMSKYREQIFKLIMSKKLENNVVKDDQTEEMTQLIDKICEMAAVMQNAIKLDETTNTSVAEKLERLRVENQGLREMLQISSVLDVKASDESEDGSSTMDSASASTSVIEVPSASISVIEVPSASTSGIEVPSAESPSEPPL